MNSIEFSKKAFDDLAKLDRVVQERINDKLDWLAKNLGNVPTEMLGHNLGEFNKLRVGDWRVVYEILANNVIHIHSVGHRSKIYKNTGK